MNRLTSAIALVAAGLVMAFPTLAVVPPGWGVSGSAPTDYEFAVDTTTAASGKASASIAAKAGARKGGFGTLMQTIAADNYRGSRWRLSGYLRTDAASRALMWMRVDGPDGKVLAFDNMESRPVTGTTAWSRYDVVLDVPPESVDIAFGFLLISSGKVWGDDFKLEKVDPTVPVTAGEPLLSRAPANTDFEDTQSSQAATWTQRKLVIAFRDNDYLCAWLYSDVRRVLVQLGARASDLKVRENCFVDRSGLEATFSVLVPGASASGESIPVRWRSVDIRLDTAPADETSTGSRLTVPLAPGRRRDLIELVQTRILPLFSIRSAKISDDTLHVELFEPRQQ
ncbi:MAG TPA: hypothetical protein VGM84_15090 [Steroidobacteraceae bacterium]|jgi:hypothetical protein